MSMRILAAALLDGAVAAAAVMATYRLRFDPVLLPIFMVGAIRTAPVAAVIVPLVCAAAGLYGERVRLWPVRLLTGCALGFALTAAAVWMIFGFDRVSRFAFPASALLTMFVAGGWRAANSLRRLWMEARRGSPASGFEDRGAGAHSIGRGLLNVLRSRELIRNLVLKDLKLKYRGSVLGFAWSLANPVLMLLVYSLAFTYILGIRKPGFVFFLLIGMLAWTFFATTLGMATGSITDGGGLLKSVRFPRAVLPLSTMLFNLAQYLMTFGVLLPIMMLIFGVGPSWPMLAYPAILLLLVLFTLGAALSIAAATAYFRDVKHLVEIALAVLFWTTPIVYDLGDVPDRLHLPILLSPMSPFVTALHDVFFHRAWPDASIWVTALAWTAASFICGLTIFLSLEDRFAEQV